jgi:hypothetical protein
VRPRLAQLLLFAALLVCGGALPRGAAAQSVPAIDAVELGASVETTEEASALEPEALPAPAPTPAPVAPLPPPVDPLAGLTITSSPDRPADLVVLVSVDGLRADAVVPSLRTFAMLRRRGVSAENDSTIRRSTTLASHAAMLSGVDDDQHGLTWNGWRPERGRIRFPTVLRVAARAGLPAVMFAGKNKLRHLIGEQEPGVSFNVVGRACANVVERATPVLRDTPAGVVVLHFAGPDSAGHRRGWMSPTYRASVAEADACVGSVIDVLRERAGGMARVLLVVTADHGGHGHSHGTPLEVDRRVPWFAWGGAAAHAQRVGRALSTMDTAATLLAALGLPQTPGMVGRPVTEALRPRNAMLAHAGSGQPAARRRGPPGRVARAEARSSQ